MPGAGGGGRPPPRRAEEALRRRNPLGATDAESQAPSFQGPPRQAPGPRPPPGPGPQPLPELPRAQAAAPGVRPLRLLQGQAGHRGRGSLGALRPMPKKAGAPRVAVDAMGGDHGPGVVVEGTVLACRALGLSVDLVGPAALIRGEVARAGGSGLSIEVVDAPDVGGMGEKGSLSTLKKRSSIQVAVERVHDGAADAFFSAGNTAVCWTIAKMILGTLEEVDRPALAAVVPQLHGRTALLDVGANAQCKARNLEEFAVMGSVYTRDVFRTASPRVGLMSMGEEETRGTTSPGRARQGWRDRASTSLGTG